MRLVVVTASVVLCSTGAAQKPEVLPELRVTSPRIANQAPAGTFAMPVSALRYEPRVDIHARNLAEGQSDITIRGGTFENTGFKVGALTLLDPQTGHYLAELPIAPSMLGAPEILTGTDAAYGVSNATVGAVAYRWRPVVDGGSLSAGIGERKLYRGDLHTGAVRELPANRRVGVEVAAAYSGADGSVPFGEHDFRRLNGRLQLTDGRSQTDLFAGYQAKFFGWPNLYTPFNSMETENIQTVLFALNHRTELGGRDFFSMGAYHRRNKDDYAFNRFAPVGPVHPFQHTTWVTGGAIEGRQSALGLAWNYRAEALADELTSTSLVFGAYRSRTILKAALLPEKTWAMAEGEFTARAGIAFDDTNRDDSAVSPLFEVRRTFAGGAIRGLHFGYAQATQVATYTALKSSPTAGLFRGNQSLGRERSEHVEAGVMAAVAGWSTEATAFWRKDDELVDWTFRRGVTARTANAVDIAVSGVELVARRGWRRLDVVTSYTFLEKDPDYGTAAVDGSFYALNFARHRLTAAITLRVAEGWELRMDNVARIQQPNTLRAVGGDEAVTSSVGLTYRPRRWRGVEAVVQVDNLWDEDFQEVPGVPAARRQLAAGVSYTW